MSAESGKQQKKENMRNIILDLHRGLSVEEAKERFLKEVGSTNSVEIAEIEQSLMDEGLSPDVIKKFCNVHALLFESSLKESTAREESPAHPVNLFKSENREIEKLTREIRAASETESNRNVDPFKATLQELLSKLRGVEIHYIRKEQLLFPYLERTNFLGPSKVMWGKDDEIRNLLRQAMVELEALSREEQIGPYLSGHLRPLLEEVEGMIFKEESILFPAAMEKLHSDEWAEIQKESEEVGYAFIEKPKETAAPADRLLKAYMEEPEVTDQGRVLLPTGDLSLQELTGMLNSLPVDITFIDDQDRVRYFSDNRERIFLRTKSVIGRSVQNCHPPQSVDAVNRILDSFRNGSRANADFWINLQGKLVYIRYFPVRDRDGSYLGTLEVSQDITAIKNLEGEKRLLDEKA